jgi:hypothetical protein
VSALKLSVARPLTGLRPRMGMLQYCLFTSPNWWHLRSGVEPAAARYFAFSVFRFCAGERKNEKQKMRSTSLPQAQSRNASATS